MPNIALIVNNVLSDSGVDLSGKADLVNGLVPSAQLPSYVDDVLAYTNLAGFPGTGETGKIYVANDTNKIYRWSGASYIEISPSPGSTDSVPEGSTNLYFTTARARNSISVSGSLSYNATTGVISYTQPNTVSTFSNDAGYITLAQARSGISVSGSLSYNSTTGVISYTQPTTVSTFTNDAGYITLAQSRAGISVSGSLSYNSTTGVISYSQPTNVSAFTNDSAYITTAGARSAISVSGSLSYNSSTGVISYTTPSTSGISEGTNLYYTDARARAALSFTAGSGAYNSSTGVITIPTNTNQLTNGAGFITGYTETDTLATVTGRGATTSTVVTFSGGDGNNSSVKLAGYNQRGGSGYHGFLEATNTFGSATNPNKYFRLDSVGSLQIINSAYTAAIFTLTNGGDLNVPGSVTAGSFVRSGGTSSQFLKADGSVDSSTYATQTYVTTQISNLVNSAPATLDTLNELAAALGNDANFSTTVTNSIATRVPQSRTLTINGTAYDLSADRSWTITAGVSSVNAGTGVSVNSTTGAVTVSIGQSVATSAQVTFDSVITNNNGNGTNVRIGDDVWLGDINLSNTLRIQGVQDATQGYIVFGNSNSTALGRSGTGALTYGGNTVYHAGNLTNLNQLTNGPGYITSYTETDTLASVTARGASTTSSITVNGSITSEGNIYISNNGGRLYFDRPNGATVGSVGWHTNDVFYVAGHPDYGPGAGNAVRVYAFGSDLHLGSANAGDVITINNSGTINANYTIVATGGSGTTPTLVLNRNIATPSNYYNGLQFEVRATSGTAGIGLHRNGFSHVGIYHDTVNVLKFDMNGGTVTLNHNTGTVWGTGNLTNLNQLTNGPGYITGYTETDTLASVTSRGASTGVDVTFGSNSTSDQGIRINYGNYSSGYGRIRFLQDGSNHSTIHSFSASWQSGGINSSTGCININGQSGVTMGAWNDPDATFVTGGTINFRRTTTISGNTVWHAGNDGSGSGLDADLLDGNHASAFATRQDGTRYSTNFNSILSSGFFNAEAQPANAPNSYGQLIVAKGADTGLQIAGGYSSQQLWFRGWGYGPEADGFWPWRRLLNDGADPYPANMNQYVRTSDDVTFSIVRGSSYMVTPLIYSGGGNVNFGNNIGLNGNNAQIQFNAAASADLFISAVPGTRTIEIRNGNSGSPNYAACGLITGYATFTSNVTVQGNLSVSTSNTTGGGIIFADDGDIVDLNDAYLSLRFSYGVRVYSANRGGSPVITLGNNGVVTATTFSGALSGNATTASSISGFNNPTTAATANTIVYRDASGDVAAREFVLTASTIHTDTPSSMLGIYPTTNQVVKFGSSAARNFLNVPTRTGGDASGTWGISISGSAAQLGGWSLQNIVPYHSGSDFPNGTLVVTNINAAVTYGDSFVMEVTGKTYGGSAAPFALLLEGYIYADTFINVSAISYGAYFPGPVRIFNYSGNLAFWWPRGSYWNSFSVTVREAGGSSSNRVTSISDSTEPSSSKKVSITPVQALNSSNYNSYAPTLTGGGASGSWNIDAASVGGRTVGTSTGNVAFLDGSRNLVTNNPESYSGEVRLGAAWNRGGIYTSNTLSLSTGSPNIDFVHSNSISARFIGNSGDYGPTLMLGTTTPSYTLIDANYRPVMYLHGQYPVLTLNHTVTSNGSHGPTIQFTHNTADRQWVIGSNGSGTRLDFGYSTFTANRNPHNGIDNYNGTTILRIDNGNYVTALNLTVSGITNLNGTINAFQGELNVNRINFRTTGGSATSDPYCLRWIDENSARGNGLSWLEFQLNDDSNEEIRIYGNSCVGYGCGAISDNLYHRFRADGYAWHAGNLAVGGSLTVGSGGSSDIYMTDTDEGTRRIHCNSNRIGFLRQNDNWGAYCDDDGNWTAVGDVTAYSDVRVKENVHTVENALDKTLRMRGVTYNRADSDDKKTKVGVIAQEMLEVLPEVVHEQADGMLGVSYGNIVGVLIEAIKEQQTQIESQKSEIEELKDLVKQLINK